jgi:predicted nucleic acid-binding protein
MSYLLDTNVVSEARRKNPDAHVVAWLRGNDPSTLYLSVLTVGEILRGIETLARRDPAAARPLRTWFDALRANYAERLVGIDARVAEVWGRLSAARPLPVIDGLLAATALTHGMTLVTRNIRDVADIGVDTFNPWEA